MELLTSCKVKPRTVNWYANRLCVTPKYLSTVCKQVSGKTAFEWINEYVGVDIKHMLKNTNLSIKEITDELNFPNMSFFGKYCRNHFGISPSEYRKQLRERTDE
jgi:AraC-like DNA-binding protein